MICDTMGTGNVRSPVGFSLSGYTFAGIGDVESYWAALQKMPVALRIRMVSYSV